MPFTKVGPNDYTSPSGRHWNKRQIALYYATDGFGKGTDETGPSHKKRKRPVDYHAAAKAILNYPR